ncbi:MAG: hypothetical protein U0L51_07155 [Olegusella sp.]|nr:hypothetical protein [Olegusella sp.]
MFRAYEFEFIYEEGGYSVIPYELEDFGGTQGDDYNEACFMAADWLKCVLEDIAMMGKEAPQATFDHKPRYGGTNVVIGVEAGLETVRKMSASEAAEVLGVSRSRISQLIKACLLYGYRDGRNTWVTCDSVEARLKDCEHLRYRAKKDKQEESADKKPAEKRARKKPVAGTKAAAAANRQPALAAAQNG